jgi:hypothetical protein
MISNELIEEYLYDIFGVGFKYDGMIVNINTGLKDILTFNNYKDIVIGYCTANNSWGVEAFPSELTYMGIHNKLGDFKVWNRKRKLENL